MTRHAKSAREEGERRIPRDLIRANFPFSFKRPEVEKRMRGNILPFSFISQAYQIQGLISFPALFPPRPKAKGNVLRTKDDLGYVLMRCHPPSNSIVFLFRSFYYDSVKQLSLGGALRGHQDQGCAFVSTGPYTAYIPWLLFVQVGPCKNCLEIRVPTSPKP